MLADALAEEILACPACRGMAAGRFVDHPLKLADVHATDARGAPLHGFLRCPGCKARYPIVDGVPIVLRDVPGWLRQQERPVLGRTDLPEAVLGPLLRAWDDDQDPNWRRQMLAIYANDLDPAADDALPGWLRAARVDGRTRLSARRAALVADASARAANPWVLDVGTAVGASAADLGRHGARVVALDHDFGPLRLIAALQRDGRASVPRWRHGGFDYVDRTIAAPAGLERVLAIAGDAQDPPLRPGRVGVITAYNVLDNVANPPLLVRQLHGTLAAGGVLALSTPYDFVSRVMPVANRLGETLRSALHDDRDPARALVDLLTGKLPAVAPELARAGEAFAVEHDDRDVPWVLSRYDRSAHVFRCHYVEARKAR